MPRIVGVNIPENKRVEIALTYIFGIGHSLSGKILEKVGINKNVKAGELTASQLNSLKEEIEAKYRIEGELRHDIMENIKRLKDISSYRGIRHIKNLPVRGQQTRTNSRTVRGNVRKTMSSGRRSVEKT
jgi:small subunit ribosomal protein S13